MRFGDQRISSDEDLGHVELRNRGDGVDVKREQDREPSTHVTGSHTGNRCLEK